MAEAVEEDIVMIGMWYYENDRKGIFVRQEGAKKQQTNMMISKL